MHRVHRGVWIIKKKAKLIGIILAVIAVFALLLYLHIFWWTMLTLLVLIVVLLHFSVSVHLKASRSEGVSVTAKWMFITLFPRGSKGSKKKKPKSDVVVTPGELDEIFGSAELQQAIDQADSDDSDTAQQESVEAPASEAQETEPEPDSSAEHKDEHEIKDEKPAKKKRKKEKPSKDDADDFDDGEPKKGKLAAIKEKFEKVKPYIPIGWKAVKKFCKAIRFEGVKIRAEVGRFDAHEAAIYYGIVQGFIFDVLGKIALFFTLKLKEANVYCRFGENKIDGEAELTVRVRPSAMIAIAFCTGVNFLITFLRERKKKKKAAKAAAEAAANASATAG